MFQHLDQLLPQLLAAAWLLPLASFTVILLLGPRLGSGGKGAAGVATAAILGSALLSFTALIGWMSQHGWTPESAGGAHHAAIETPAESPTSIQFASFAADPTTPAAGDPAKEHATNLPAQPAPEHHAPSHANAHGHATHGHGHDDHGHAPTPPKYYAGDWYDLGVFGQLRISIGYYIDALTVVMFCMVTFIASCIHFYASGYMHDELHDVTDHEVTLEGNPHDHGHGADHGHAHDHSHAQSHGHADAHGHDDSHGHADDHGHGHGHHDAHGGNHLHRPGRYHRFFQYLSLFCFSMLGIVLAGNIAMVFVFWELVGVCSYFLIGFYVERKSASTAANKAFIANRVGDFGMIIGLMALWASVGTFTFGDVERNGQVQPGLFSQVRSPERGYRLAPADGMVLVDAEEMVVRIVRQHVGMRDDALLQIQNELDDWRRGTGELLDPQGNAIPDTEHFGYWLLVVAGLGIFCGCVGKSAQFPLHVWLPDAMEGPTPVSALVHSATMVAAGVYLVGRFYPVFAPEALLVIAYTGAITLFLAATIAITATDIKRVLAYSTISQLGYMILALGVGGWVAGLFHLITHAFFKSLLFMCSGSVIHACHTNEMPKMGGLRHKMPYTAYTMLVGCLAIIGAGIPFLIGFSGYYSKDAIVEQALSFWQANPRHGAVFFLAAAGGAAITAFYMFRLWFMTFAGTPRDHHIYEHAHESPPVMYVPLIVLSVMAIGVGWTVPGLGLSVTNLLEQARPAIGPSESVLIAGIVHPDEHLSHAPAIVIPATLIAFSTAMAGLLLAILFYGQRKLNPNDVRQQFDGVYRFLVNKWYFDELYDFLFIRPCLAFGRVVSRFDKLGIDSLIDATARGVKRLADVDDLIDRYFIDGIVNLTASWIRSLGYALHRVQTGRLRQYVMLIVIGTVALTVVFRWALAGG